MDVRELMKKKKFGKMKILTNGKENLTLIRSRMKGWQLDTFNQSYNHKIKEGISLYKKSLK